MEDKKTFEQKFLEAMQIYWNTGRDEAFHKLEDEILKAKKPEECMCGVEAPLIRFKGKNLCGWCNREANNR